MRNTSTKTLLLLILLLLLIIIFLLFRCCCNKESVQPPKWFSHITTDTSGLVVLKKPGIDPASFMHWLDSVRVNCGDIAIVNACADCDSNLLLLNGPGAVNYIQGQTAQGGRGGNSGPSGGDGPVYYSMNFQVSFTDTIFSQRKSPNDSLLPIRPSTKSSVVVAVFDTGVDPGFRLNGNFYDGTASTSCLGPNANNGWNFANWNDIFLDDYPSKHGTAVSRFIVDQVLKYGENGIKILPVKTHKVDGAGSLFNVLCGMAYAKERGAKIINASFGFYAPMYIGGTSIKDTSATLLKKYVEQYLIPNNILLIAAAGNRDDFFEGMVYNPVDSVSSRNLDSVNFYPASLAREMQNVIAVTTVSNGSGIVCPTQNFSRHVVDVGINADRESDFVFQNPLQPANSVIGSSFATPILTGKLCAHYDMFKDLLGTGFTKTALWSRLNSELLPHNSSLDSMIINGVVMKK